MDWVLFSMWNQIGVKCTIKQKWIYLFLMMLRALGIWYMMLLVWRFNWWPLSLSGESLSAMTIWCYQPPWLCSENMSVICQTADVTVQFYTICACGVHWVTFITQPSKFDCQKNQQNVCACCRQCFTFIFLILFNLISSIRHLRLTVLQ